MQAFVGASHSGVPGKNLHKAQKFLHSSGVGGAFGGAPPPASDKKIEVLVFERQRWRDREMERWKGKEMERQRDREMMRQRD